MSDPPERSHRTENELSSGSAPKPPRYGFRQPSENGGSQRQASSWEEAMSSDVQGAAEETTSPEEGGAAAAPAAPPPTYEPAPEEIRHTGPHISSVQTSHREPSVERGQKTAHRTHKTAKGPRGTGGKTNKVAHPGVFAAVDGSADENNSWLPCMCKIFVPTAAVLVIMILAARARVESHKETVPTFRWTPGLKAVALITPAVFLLVAAFMLYEQRQLRKEKEKRKRMKIICTALFGVIFFAGGVAELLYKYHYKSEGGILPFTEKPSQNITMRLALYFFLAVSATALAKITNSVLGHPYRRGRKKRKDLQGGTTQGSLATQ